VTALTYKVKLSRLRNLSALLSLTSICVIVLIPSLYIAGLVLMNWRSIIEVVFFNPLIGSAYWADILRYLAFSFKIAITTTIIDLLIGLPLAYLVARKEIRGKSLVEDVVTLTLVLPTSGFGFAILIAWSGILESNVVLPIVGVPVLILLAHVALTLPYVVKTLSAALKTVEKAYEIVSLSLGASSITTFRKVTLPMILPSILSSVTLALTRSLGETGATMVVAGVQVTASIAIVKWVFEFKLEPAILLSSLLVIISLALILPAERLTRVRRHKLLPLKRFEYLLFKLERSFPKPFYLLKDIIPLLLVVVLVIYPLTTLLFTVIEYWDRDPYTGKLEGGVVYYLFGPPSYFEKILSATITSLLVALLSTLVSTYMSLLALFVIVKFKYGGFIRALLKIPLIIPTSSLGLSSLLFWSALGLAKPSVWLTILTHITFSVPIIVETTLSTYESANLEPLEEVSRTLGASPYVMAETITIPLIKRGIIAGSILAFAHSLGETGATFLVMGRDVTVPVLVVNMVESLAIPAALFTATYLIGLSLAMFIVIRFILTKE